LCVFRNGGGLLFIGVGSERFWALKE